MLGQSAMYILSFFVISLGGISLFIQKIYKLDEKGGETVIELPFVGKLTTNYPALGFVFIGAAMAIFTFSRTNVAGAEKWFVTGQFTPPRSKDVAWKSGVVSVDPKAFDTKILGDGTFTIEGDLKGGETFEDAVRQITYQNEHFLGRILVQEAYDDYKKNLPTSILRSATDTGRSYKPVEVISVGLQQ